MPMAWPEVIFFLGVLILVTFLISVVIVGLFESRKSRLQADQADDLQPARPALRAVGREHHGRPATSGRRPGGATRPHRHDRADLTHGGVTRGGVLRRWPVEHRSAD